MESTGQQTEALALSTTAPRSGSIEIYNMEPRAMMERGAQIASALSDVIEKQHLYVLINNKKFVTVVGWCLMGSMLGIIPREDYAKELDDGSYEGGALLYSANSGQIVGGASSLCGIDEKKWGNTERYARRSMSVTRATGKAFRLGYAWIMALAGYETTPAEEMPRDHSKEFGEKARQSLAQLLDALHVPKALWGEIGAICKAADPLDWVQIITANASRHNTATVPNQALA